MMTHFDLTLDRDYQVLIVLHCCADFHLELIPELLPSTRPFQLLDAPSFSFPCTFTPRKSSKLQAFEIPVPFLIHNDARPSSTP